MRYIDFPKINIKNETCFEGGHFPRDYQNLHLNRDIDNR